MERVEEHVPANEPESELEPGDLLFSVVNVKGKEYIAHALIYAPNDEFPLLPVIHAVSNERKNLYRVMATSIPEGDFRVFRCKDNDLRLKAADQAIAWSLYNTPYDQDRKNLQNSVTAQLDAMATRSGVEPDSEFRLKNQRKFADDNLPLNAIKYASRRNGPLTLPKDDQLGHGAGVRCSMFAAICYQASAISDQVKPNPPGTWSSNKHADPDQMPKVKLERLSVREIRRFSSEHKNRRLSGKFQTVVENKEEYKKINIPHVEEERPHGEKHQSYRPVVLNWSSEKYPAISGFDFKKAVTPGLYFDQKTIDIVDMVYSLEQDDDNWQERPRLHVAKKVPTEDEKINYSAQVARFTDQADKRTDAFKEELKVNLGLTKSEKSSLEEQETMDIVNRNF